MAFGSPQVAFFHLRRALKQSRYTRMTILIIALLLFAYTFSPGFTIPSLSPSETPILRQADHLPLPSVKSPAQRPLWSYVSDFKHQADERRRALGDEEGAGDMGGFVAPESTGAWEWVNSQRRTTPPSKGAIVSEGAKASFRANLRADKQYFLPYLIGGWNNQVMGACNAIYLSILLGRVPILPGFDGHPPHVGGVVPTLAIGEVFDLAFLSSALKKLPIIESHELKLGDRPGTRLQYVKRSKPAGGPTTPGDIQAEYIRAVEPVIHETLGCWRFSPNADPWPHTAFSETKMSWTPMPRSVLYNNQRTHVSVHEVAEVFKSYQTGQIPEDSLAQLDGVLQTPPPDQKVLCLDSTYFFCMNKHGDGLHHEWRNGEGVWHFVGQYLRYQPALIRMAQDLLKDMLGVPADQPMPLYFGVHIRRGDFENRIKEFTPRQWAYRIAEILLEYREDLGITIEHVAVTTDEQDEDWLNQLRAYGFTIVDHKKAQTPEKLDRWFSTVIDSIILSSGKVFLGVSSSTMSILALRRVVDWQAGVGYYLDYPNLNIPDEWTWSMKDFIKGAL